MEKPFATSLVIGTLSLITLGCGTEAGERIDNRLDCRQICERYEECADSDYDVDECRDDCKDNANADSDFEAKVERCSDCLDDDNSCTADAFECATECVGIVP